MRESVYNNGGIPEFYGINLLELQEMGAGQRFNKIFDAQVVADMNLPGGAYGAFADGSHEIVLGLDRSRDALLRAIALDAETGSEMSLAADDQYSVRQNKIGYYASLEEGRMIIDDRALFGITV